MANTSDSDEVMDYNKWDDDVNSDDMLSDVLYCSMIGNIWYDACHNDEDPFYNSGDSLDYHIDSTFS